MKDETTIRTHTHPACLSVEELLKQCETTRSRTGGPGGQHRNKVSSAVYITHKPTNVSAEATERRSQEQNRTVAVFRLRVNLALAVRTPIREPYTPSTVLASRVRKGLLKVNPEHDDFPAILAEVFDLVANFGFDVRETADRIGTSATQVVNLLKVDYRALKIVNDARAEKGLSQLK